MIEFLAPVLQSALTFLLCSIVVLGGIALFVLFAKSALMEVWNRPEGAAVSSVELVSINDSFRDAQIRALEVLDDRAALAAVRSKQPPTSGKRLFVIDFFGDLRATQVEELREQITLILLIGSSEDEVLLRLESPGGDADSYALGAEQLKRLRAGRITLTASVDLVAASGGYMMAVVADHIVASPEAEIGSIGAVMEIPNFSDLLQKIGISFHSVVSGPAKRPMPLFSPVTEEGKKFAASELERCFVRFKQHVAHYRPKVELDKVESGDVWPASEALELGLVDSLGLSDDIILQRFKEGWQIHRVECAAHSPFSRWRLPFISRLSS